MQTAFSATQLADPDIRESEKILRSCVHCGFCTATCPTYLLLGDELDSPRGRIYLIKDMLENGKAASPDVARHVDRCLSCLSCMSTCPSGVHYMHLVDHARKHIEETHRRALPDRLMRSLLALVLPRPALFRWSLVAAGFARMALPVLRSLPFQWAKRLSAMLALAPVTIPERSAYADAAAIAAEGKRVGRVVIMRGCAQSVLAPEINEAATRLLIRHGIEVVYAAGEGCCGALVHHMGKQSASHDQARRNIDAWIAEMDSEGLDAIIMTASGCGTTVKDYGHMFRDDPEYAAKAARVSAMTRDISEYISTLSLQPPTTPSKLVVAYHSACSMQHGQQIKTTAQGLLRKAGFVVKDVPEGHICCGSAGVYNILQPAIAGRLRERKAANIGRLKPAVIATGNIGCMTQLAGALEAPILHTVELLDWASGGPLPAKLSRSALRSTAD